MFVWEPAAPERGVSHGGPHATSSTLLASLKDSTKFEGGWGFFDFSGTGGAPPTKARALPESRGCRTCHRQSAKTTLLIDGMRARIPCMSGWSKSYPDHVVFPELLMTHRYIKIGVTALVLAAAFGGLMWSTLREGTEYYKHVDEVMSSPDQWRDKQLQLHGFVVPGSIHAQAGQLRLHLQGPQQRPRDERLVHRHRAGHFFQEGAEVVLKGRLTPEGGFHTDPNGIMAKCPSKYEEAKVAKKVG